MDIHHNLDTHHKLRNSLGVVTDRMLSLGLLRKIKDKIISIVTRPRVFLPLKSVQGRYLMDNEKNNFSSHIWMNFTS